MTCMCGDSMCPSCGPAQGYDPEFEIVTEWLQFGLLEGLHESINEDWLTNELAQRLSGSSPQFIEAIVREAQDWAIRERRRNSQGEDALGGV